MGVDITERKQGRVLNLASTIMSDRDTRVAYWNPGAQQRYGWSQEEALGKNAHTFLQTIFPRPLGEIQAILLQEGYWQGELKHATRDGRRIMVASRWSLQRDERGEPAGFLRRGRGLNTARFDKKICKSNFFSTRASVNDATT